MKKLLASIMLSLMFLMPIGSFAANWQWVASTDQASYYVDIDSMRTHKTGGLDVDTKIQYLDGSYDINKIEFTTNKKGYDAVWAFLVRQSFDASGARVFYSNDARIFSVPWKPVADNSLEYKYLAVLVANK